MIGVFEIEQEKPHPRAVCVYTACFANKHGKCRCLYNNDFGGRICPFFKKTDKKKNMNKNMQ